MTSLKDQPWSLPNKPSKGPDGKIVWHPVVRVGRYVPFGYKKDPENDHVLLPIPEELELLEKAKLYLRDYSSRQVAAWLSEESGREISHVGLLKRVYIERSRKQSSANARRYAKLYKEAVETAQKIETRIGGRKAADIPKDHKFFKARKDRPEEEFDPDYFENPSDSSPSED
jgi:hypothetical protein